MKSRTLAAVVLAGAVAVTAAGCASSASSSSSSSAPAACGPLVAIIGYVMPVLDQAVPGHATGKGAIPPAPRYPWQDTSSEIYDAGQFAPSALSLDADTVANAIGSLGAGLPAATWQPVLRKALGEIRAACPALPASVVNGPLPR